MSKRAEQQAYKDYLDLVEQIKKQTKSVKIETPEEKQKRIKKLLGNYDLFCKYYFARYMDSDFAWFHKKAFEVVEENENLFAVCEWPREHAKSVILDIFIPMWLKAKDELTGVLLGSSNGDKAKGLLGDLQAELQGNQLYINDFGEQISYGDWSTGHFKTRDGVGFWAFGRGQSPRGAREAEKRPNYGVIDDIDDKVIVKNQERVNDAIEWVMEDFYGALSIKASRLLVAGNRIHNKSILAHLVGDITPKDPKRKGLKHIKAYAIENPKTREKAGINNGQPAWGRYTLKILKVKMETMGYRSSRREFFHEHIEEGLIFKKEWIKWGKVPNIKEYDAIVKYTDPSFTNNKGSDYKAHVVLGKKGKQYYIDFAWVRQASIKSMVVADYDIYERFTTFAQYWMEANFLQGMLLDEYDREADERKQAMPIRGDKTKKPHKFVRIENLSPLFERGLFTFNEEERDNIDMLMLISQLLGFGGGGHDDAPDALEGAKTKIDKMVKQGKFRGRSGKYKKQSR